METLQTPFLPGGDIPFPCASVRLLLCSRLFLAQLMSFGFRRLGFPASWPNTTTTTRVSVLKHRLFLSLILGGEAHAKRHFEEGCSWHVFIFVYDRF